LWNVEFVAIALELPPTRFDVAAAKAIERSVTPPIERILSKITWAADEKLLLAASAAYWAANRVRGRPGAIRDADLVCVSMIIAAATPHVAKLVVNRTRPDRAVVGFRRHGIPRSGNAHDSFPSGHAVHLAALAAALMRFVPGRWRRMVWPTAVSLAMTRLGLLAHYPTDVAAGLALGVLIERASEKLVFRGPPSSER
jgi:membrane-associated phospholipid phosphatase